MSNELEVTVSAELLIEIQIEMTFMLVQPQEQNEAVSRGTIQLFISQEESLLAIQKLISPNREIDIHPQEG
jgi:hypothetical protein